jgi:tubulin polyglutamylase TTLL6/13
MLNELTKKELGWHLSKRLTSDWDVAWYDHIIAEKQIKHLENY